jgi:hypothetical protein
VRKQQAEPNLQAERHTEPAEKSKPGTSAVLNQNRRFRYRYIVVPEVYMQHGRQDSNSMLLYGICEEQQAVSRV